MRARPASYAALVAAECQARDWPIDDARCISLVWLAAGRLGFFLGRARALLPAAGRRSCIRCRPTMALFLALGVLVPMLLDLRRSARRSPSASSKSQAARRLRSGASLPTICNAARRFATSIDVASGQYVGDADAATCKPAPKPTRRSSASADWLLLGAGLVLGLARPCIRCCARYRRRFARAIVRAHRQARAARLRGRRRPDHDRHRLFGAVRDAALLLSKVSPFEFLFGLHWSRRPRYAPTRWVRRARSASCRWSLERC